MIEQIHQQTGHGIRPICQVLAVPRSSYYHASNPRAFGLNLSSAFTCWDQISARQKGIKMFR